MTLSEIVDGLIAKTITKSEGIQALQLLGQADQRERVVLSVLNGIASKDGVFNRPAVVQAAYEYAALVVKIGNKVAG